MTTYSFGNRWVGIIALGEPDPPEPLHKMAIRLMQESQTPRIAVSQGLSVPAGELLPAPRNTAVHLTALRDDSSGDRNARRGALAAPWLRHQMTSVTETELTMATATPLKMSRPVGTTLSTSEASGSVS